MKNGIASKKKRSTTFTRNSVSIAASQNAEVSPPKTIVFGAGGFVGRHLLAAYRKTDPTTIGTARSSTSGLVDFSFENPDLLRLRGKEQGAKYAVIAAAMTHIARCEKDLEGAYVANVLGPLALAKQLRARDITPIVFSSDYVFDGTIGDYVDAAALQPCNVYGRTKAELERRLPEVCGDDYLVIRLSKVFGLHRADGTLLDEMAARFMQGVPVRAAVDQVFCPSWIDDVVLATIALQMAGARGVYNVCSAEAVSRHQLALRLAAAMGVPTKLVQSISLDDLGEEFVRPKRTSMVCERLWKILPAGFRSLESCLQEMAAQYHVRKEVA